MRFSRSIGLLSWLDEAAAFEPAARIRNTEFDVASAAGACSSQRPVHNHTVGVGVRARYGARYIVPVSWDGRIGWLRSYERSNPDLAPDLSVLAAAQCI